MTILKFDNTTIIHLFLFTIIKTQVKIIEKITKRLMVLVVDKTKVFLLNKLNKSYIDSKSFQIH